ncbi:MAG: hypothetical protein CM1200mP36_04240 [Gammaproteobacteria bacterium]|nr:MAG: hypothetical protein CM1200mP36_04240 [Gammaproteobacteria bacterium]
MRCNRPALVQLDTAWVDRLRSLAELANRAVGIATVLLSLAVVVVIGNTIRLEIKKPSGGDRSHQAGGG